MIRTRSTASPVARRLPRWRGAARAAAIALAAAAPAAVWGPSCLLGGFDQVPEPPPPPDPCAHIEVPGPPDAGAGAGPDLTFVSALRTLDLGDAPDASPVGFDLDDECTCLEGRPSCLPVIPPPAEITVDPPLGCDLTGGLDNAGAALFRILREAGGASNFGSEYFSGLAEQGEFSLLMRVRGYNGGPDDPQVQFDWFVSPSFSAGAPGAVPAWDGTDVWPVLQDSTLDGTVDSPKYSDPQAYVTGGVLVAAFPTIPVKLGESTSTMSLRISGGFVVAELGEINGAPSVVRGTLVGRWTLDEVFNSVSSYRGAGGIPFCIGFPFYAQAKQYLCAAADILAAPGSPTATCDSLSFGLAFTTHPAVLGTVQPPGALPGMACPAPVDPANDTCNTLVDAGAP